MTATDPMPTAGVVGLGAVGSSVCLALRWAGYRVVGYDIVPGRSDQVLEWGGVSVAALSLDSLVSERPDLVFVAVPPEAVVAIGQSLLNVGLVVTDVCSVKSTVVDALDRYPQFVGGHPLAGTDQVGPSAGRANLFQQANWVLTPGHDTDIESLAVVVRAVRAMGALPVLMDADGHDKAVAYTSHLPHIVAAALSASVGQSAPEFGRLAGPGFRDTTRVANGPANMWRQILEANRDHVLPAIDAMRAELDLVYRALCSYDSAALVDHLGRGASCRREILDRAPFGVTGEDAMATASSRSAA